MAEDLDVFEVSSCIRGYHYYGKFWVANIGEILARISGLYFWYRPRFPVEHCKTFLTSSLALEMACESKDDDSGPFGSGKLSTSRKYLSSAIRSSLTSSNLVN